MNAAITNPPHSLGTVRTIAHRVLRKMPNAAVIGVHWERPWGGEAVPMEVDGHTCIVRYADSALAIRELLASHDPTADDTLIVLTPCTSAVVGADVVGRLAYHQLHDPDRWESVLQVFGARRHDRRLNDLPLLADALIEAAPPNGYPPLLSGTLDLDTAWRWWARTALELQQVDAATLLRASAQQQLAIRNVGESLVTPFGSWLQATVGALAAYIIRVEERLGEGGAAALGLALAPLLAADQQRLLQSLGQLTEMLGMPADAVLLHSFRNLVTDMAPDLFIESDIHARAVVQQASALVQRLHVSEWVDASDILTEAFEARVRAVGTALMTALDLPDTAHIQALEQAVHIVRAHRAATSPDGAARCRTFDMAVRAVRWLHTAPTDGSSFGATAKRYAVDGSWIDIAWRALWEGDTEITTSAAFVKLTALLADRQRAEYRQFAQTLPGTDPSCELDGIEVIPVERILERVVVPLSRHLGVLLVVLDGYALPVHHQVMEGLVAQGWSPIVPSGVQGQVGVAMLPTVTHVSRASLLGGAPTIGQMDAELRAFRSAPALAQVQPPASLFHQRDLGGGAGQALSNAVTSAVVSKDPVVAVVVNTVDDMLHKGTYPVAWKLDDLPKLSQLLRLADEAERVVVITADHGHLVQQDMVMQAPVESGGERWRPSASSPATAQEVELHGPRVLLGDPGVTMPWGDDVRYAPKKGGYHGGASPAEVLVPLVVLTREYIPQGWVAAAAVPPPWWTDGAMRSFAPVRPARRQDPELFPPSAPGVRVEPVAAATPAWVSTVLNSESWQTRAVGRRVALERAQLERLLVAFEERGGVLPFSRITELTGTLAGRVPGLLAVLAQQCNVEGFAILTSDASSGEARLDLAMLRTQFSTKPKAKA